MGKKRNKIIKNDEKLKNILKDGVFFYVDESTNFKPVKGIFIAQRKSCIYFYLTYKGVCDRMQEKVVERGVFSVRAFLEEKEAETTGAFMSRLHKRG